MTTVWLGLQSERGMHKRVVPGDTTIQELKTELMNDHPDWDERFTLLYKGRILDNDEIVQEIVQEGDVDPVFDVSHFDPNYSTDETSGDDHVEVLESAEVDDCLQNANDEIKEYIRLSVVFGPGETLSKTVRTVAELRIWASEVAARKNMQLSDLRLGDQSILKFSPSILLRDVVSEVNQRTIICKLVPFGTSSRTERQTPATLLLDNLFEAQAERERIAHINQMAYNSKMLSVSLLALANFVEIHQPQLQGELLKVLKKNHEATDLMREALAAHSLQGEVFYVEPTGPSTSLKEGRQIEPRNLEHRPVLRHRHRVANVDEAVNANNQMRQQPAEMHGAPAMRGADAGAGNQLRRRIGGGVAARVPRVAALIVIDFRLLFKLGLIVAVLGHDAGPREFYFIIFVAIVVYLASTNMLPMPFLERFTVTRFGRIPNAERAGFFVDVWTMVSSFFLSIIPAWQVVAEDPPQVQPMMAQPVALPGGM